MQLGQHGNGVTVTRFGTQVADRNRVVGGEGKFANGSIPDNLRTVGVGVGQVSVADGVLFSVVNAQQNRVLSRRQQAGQLVAVGRGQALLLLRSRFGPVDKYPALPEHPFQHQLNLLALPTRRNHDGAPVPGRTHVAVLAGQLVQALAGERWF